MVCPARCPQMLLRGLKCGAGPAAATELLLLPAAACGCQHPHGAQQDRWRSTSSIRYADPEQFILLKLQPCDVGVMYF